MGIVFGKTGVKEPAFTNVLTGCGTAMSYDVRSYGVRYAACTDFVGTSNENGDGFRLLASYIGVFGDPKNERSKTDAKIDMTAPVVTNPASAGTKIDMTAPVVTNPATEGTKIAMTAPVVMKANGGSKQTMEFILPAEFDSMKKIPKPTNPAVYLKEVPASTGAVYRFSGWVDEKKAKKLTSDFIEQINDDGAKISENEGSKKSLLWQYHPPFTVPFLRRNEIWIELDKAQVTALKKKYEKIGVTASS
eukprot:CAMPEP_0113311214 /NCGR_PEP_ID=MMETSP0010_2-20120614/8538_1 /TAXON_ID=216773 ORGANISM="Corethron hystrix, Strain 308" /NCGR_SAMPLE_ID=MMETSP0010_2 /ASSEMBLY_ACC=CAM_ASM_000155 /LENGTH=247 /DNA_ID=CAMNT_0000166803 /DNA_START=238 /DNA_END=981 /DNA_ORIENTATION=- /assembly_acc=CAM_ASM_000155